MGIYDRDWYHEHHGAKPRNSGPKPKPKAAFDESATETRYQQAPPIRVRRYRPTTWLDRNWWRLISWAAVLAVVLAIGKQAARHL